MPQGTALQDLFLKVTEKEAGQQLAEGVALACSAQVMEIQDMDYELNELGGKLGRDIEVYSVGPVEDLTICKETVKQVMMMMMINQMVLTERLAILHNTLITESDVTSSMMGKMYRQLASAQLRGRLYKTGYRRMRASPKEVQIGTAGQNATITTGRGVSAVATGTPVALVPGTSQLKTPPRLVRLVTVPKAPVSTQTVVVTLPSSLVPQIPIISIRQIQDKTPQTLTTIKQQPSNATVTAPAQRAAVAVKRRGRQKAQPVATCQMLDTIEEVNEDSQMYPDLDFGKTESEAVDLCEILEENSDLSVDELLIDLATDQT